MTTDLLTRHARADDLLRRDAALSGDFDGDGMFVEAIASTFADVARRDARGPYIERLDPAGLDLASVVDAPLLDGHRQGSARDVIGIASHPRIEAGALHVRLRLSAADDVKPTIQRIREKLLRLSVGYTVQRWAESVDPATRQRIRSAVAWRIVEISAVAVPADAGAHFRTAKRNPAMEDETIEMPTELQTQIRSFGELADLPPSWAEGQITAGATLDEARTAARDELRQRSGQTPRIRVTNPGPSPEDVQTRMADALAYRMGSTAEIAPEAREYVSMTPVDMMRDGLSRSGVSVRGLSPDEIIGRSMHGTSDFPIAAGAAVNKVALESYKAAESPLKALARQRTLPDFKESTSIRIGGAGRLEEMTEHGEFKATSRAENGEKLALTTFGRRIDFSRKLLINNDVAALGDSVSALGQAAAQTEADLMVALLLDNPKMSDGTAVFHATRGNLASPGAAPSEETLSAARLALRQRKDLDGKTLIGARPKYLVVGPELETDGEKLLSAINATTTDDVNPFAGKLSLMVEPRIPGKQWFIFADPAQLAGMQYAYLSGAQGVQIQRQENWNTLGVSWRAFLDFGAAWTDWRAAQKNPGA